MHVLRPALSAEAVAKTEREAVQQRSDARGVRHTAA